MFLLCLPFPLFHYPSLLPNISKLKHGNAVPYYLSEGHPVNTFGQQGLSPNSVSGIYQLRDLWCLDHVTAILNTIKRSLEQECSLYLHFTISFSIQWQGITPKSCLFRLYRPTLMDLTLCVHVCVCVAQSCPTLCNPVGHSLPGSVHGIFQPRILDLAVIPFSRGPSWPMDQTQVSWFAGRLFTFWVTRELEPT